MIKILLDPGVGPRDVVQECHDIVTKALFLHLLQDSLSWTRHCNWNISEELCALPGQNDSTPVDLTVISIDIREEILVEMEHKQIWKCLHQLFDSQN